MLSDVRLRGEIGLRRGFLNDFHDFFDNKGINIIYLYFVNILYIYLRVSSLSKLKKRQYLNIKKKKYLIYNYNFFHTLLTMF